MFGHENAYIDTQAGPILLISTTDMGGNKDTNPIPLFITPADLYYRLLIVHLLFRIQFLPVYTCSVSLVIVFQVVYLYPLNIMGIPFA